MKNSKLIYKGFGFCLVLLFAATLVSAAINPVYKECMQRGYDTSTNTNTGEAHCVFPDGSTCPIEDFNSGTCGQEWMTEDYCVEQGVPVWDEDMCCAGLEPYLPEGMVGQATCQPTGGSIVEMSVSPDKTTYDLGEKVEFTVRVDGPIIEPLVIITPPGGYGEWAVTNLEDQCTAALPASCHYYGSFKPEEEGTYTITANIEVNEGEYVVERAKVTVKSVSDESEFWLKAYTDKSEYEVGEKARISAKLSSDGADVSGAYAIADVGMPDGSTEKLKLEQTLCSESVCECPRGINCDCIATTVSCTYEGYLYLDSEGSYHATATAQPGSGGEASDSVKFLAYESSGGTQYVRLDQRFELSSGGSAVVVDFGDMRLTLRGFSKSYAPLAELTVRGPKEWETIAYDDDIGAVGGAVRPAYEEMQVSIKEGASASIFGAEISFLEYEGGYGLFIVSKEGNGDYVDVKIEPSRQSIELGDMARYQVTLRDLHGRSMEARGYNYKIKVSDLPFDLKYDSYATLSPGEELAIPLYVYTSSIYPEAPEDTEGTVVEPIDESVEGGFVEVRNTFSEAAESEEVEIVPDVVASGRAYKFRVTVYGDDGSEATAYAILNVLYSPPPSLPSVKIGLVEGWNLVTLPGEGELSQGSCSSELYAFVYIKEKGEYMTLEEATDHMGESRLKDYLSKNAFWVYSFNRCSLTFELESETSFNELSLGKGWNFVPVTGDMEGNSLGDIAGDCGLERVYYWNPAQQDWEEMSLGMRFTSDMVYRGFVAKAENACDFGWGAILTPPSLPE